MNHKEYKKAYEKYYEFKSKLDKFPFRSFVFGLYSQLKRYYFSEMGLSSHKNI